MAYTSQIPIRDNYDEEDASDDVEDEVFIRDGKNCYKMDEERGLKRPLMAPRRKSKSNVPETEIYKASSKLKILCKPFCLMFLILITLLGVILLFISLFLWLPISFDRMQFWRHSSKYEAFQLIPCTEISVQSIWTNNFSKITSQPAFALSDINNDEILDIIIGYGTGPVPEYACPLYFGGRQAPCLGGVLALDGRNGSILWRHWAAHLVSNIDCEIDLTGDKIRDCLSSGDNGAICALNGHDGSVLWEQSTAGGSTTAARYIYDIDNDNVPEVLAVFSQRENLSNEGGGIVLVSGASGAILQRRRIPNVLATFAPRILVDSDGGMTLLYAEETTGCLVSLPWSFFISGNFHQGKLVVLKTSAWTPLLVDLNRDGSEDIVVVTSSITTTNSNITITAFNGPTLKPLWHFSTPSMARILGPPTPGYFNDDNIPDLLITLESIKTLQSWIVVLDGANGHTIMQHFLPLLTPSTSHMMRGSLLISVQGFGNDLFLNWSPRTGSRIDNGLFALSQHLEPPGELIYSSVDHENQEVAGAVDTFTEIQGYLASHPDFRLTNSDKSLFRHKVTPVLTNNRMPVKVQLPLTPVGVEGEFWKPELHISGAPDVRKHGKLPNRPIDYQNYIPWPRRNILSMNNRPATSIEKHANIGTVVPPFNLKGNSQAIDIIFATHWIPTPSDYAAVVDRVQDCIKQKFSPDLGSNSYDTNGASLFNDCLESSVIDGEDISLPRVSLGQMTVYRLRIFCKCMSKMAKNERCTKILPFEKQSWSQPESSFRTRSY